MIGTDSCPIFNPRPCAVRVTVVGSVCLSMLQLTSRLFLRPTNDTCTGNDNQFIEPFFLNMLLLQRSDHSTHTNSWPFLLCGKRTCALFLPRDRSLSVGEEDVLKFREFKFALTIMSPSKVFPQCQGFPTMSRFSHTIKVCSEVREKQTKPRNAWECQRPLKERQKLASKLCIENSRVHKARERANVHLLQSCAGGSAL